MAASSSNNASGRKPRVNLKDLKKLIDMMRKAELSEINIEQEGIKIALKRGAEPQIQMAPMALPPQAPVYAVTTMPVAATVAPADEEETINSPMVGTFYRAGSPDAEPYVKEGMRVEIGQTVCIIEAMKLMNEIKAETAGVIVKVLAENAQPIEFGQPLFAIKS